MYSSDIKEVFNNMMEQKLREAIEVPPHVKSVYFGGVVDGIALMLTEQHPTDAEVIDIVREKIKEEYADMAVKVEPKIFEKNSCI